MLTFANRSALDECVDDCAPIRPITDKTFFTCVRCQQKAFIANAPVEGGVVMQVWSNEEISPAIHLVRQAYDQVSD